MPCHAPREERRFDISAHARILPQHEMTGVAKLLLGDRALDLRMAASGNDAGARDMEWQESYPGTLRPKLSTAMSSRKMVRT